MTKRTRVTCFSQFEADMQTLTREQICDRYPEFSKPMAMLFLRCGHARLSEHLDKQDFVWYPVGRQTKIQSRSILAWLNRDQLKRAS